MRFTSVGPKWRAALRSSLLSLSLPSPSCPLGCRPPPPPSCRVRLSVRWSVRPSVRRYLSSSPAHSGPRGTAQTAGMHQMHRADRYPSPFHRFHLFTSAVCLSLFLLPGSLLLSPSRSFVSFFSGRLLRLREPLSHPLHRSAAAVVATPGYGPLLYHRCGGAPLLLHALIVVRARTHVRTHAPVRRRGTLCRRCRGIHTGPSIATRSHYVRSRALPPRFLFLSSLPEVSLPRWPSSPCPSIAFPFTPRSRDDPRSWERGPGSIGCRSAPLTGLTAASTIDRDPFRVILKEILKRIKQ